MSFAFYFTKNPSTQYRPLLSKKAEREDEVSYPSDIKDCIYAFDKEWLHEGNALESSLAAAIEARAERILNDGDIRQVLFSSLGMAEATFWLQDYTDEEHFSIAAWLPNNYIVEIAYECGEVSVVFWDMRKMYFG